jgi:hypothetical protein
MEVLSQLSYAPTKTKVEILSKTLKKTSSAAPNRRSNMAYYPAIFNTSLPQSETLAGETGHRTALRAPRGNYPHVTPCNPRETPVSREPFPQVLAPSTKLVGETGLEPVTPCV